MTSLLLTIAIVALCMTALSIGVILKGKCMLGGCARHSGECSCKGHEETDDPESGAPQSIS